MRNGALLEQRFWKHLSKSIEGIEKEYDVAIGFLEKNPIYFCVDKVKAKKKIGWIHTEYNKLGILPTKENEYFQKLDYIVTVSEELVNILKKHFPEHVYKYKCIYNIVSTKMINKMSEEKVEFRDESITLISVGRLAKEKGLDISLEACEILTKRGYDIKWYLIGDGNMRDELERSIKEKNLSNRVVFLGLKENPYSYIKDADIYIQTSKYEGKSISIDEAKVLAKPIVITNFATASNHIIDQKTGIISPMDGASVADSIELIIKETDFRNELIYNLKNENFGTEGEIEKFYELVSS